jgi:glycosyltransferase involved in cell wall biosynthesis
VHTVHLGVLEVLRKWLREPIAEDERTVLMFGRLSPYKGLDVLYEAAPRVAERVPGVRFVVAGRPVPGYVPPPPPRLPNGGRVDVHAEYISNNELVNLFQRASVIACPYRDATQSAVALTGYAFERPIVATLTGGLPEYIRDGETGLLVPAGNAAALADALVQVLLDPRLKARLQRGVASARRDWLTWENAAQQTLAAYGEMLGPPTSGEVGPPSGVAYSARS